MHGFVKYCKGIMTITNNGLQFTSNDHNLTYTNTDYVMQAGISNTSWVLQVIDRATQRKIAEFFVKPPSCTSPGQRLEQRHATTQHVGQTKNQCQERLAPLGITHRC